MRGDCPYCHNEKSKLYSDKHLLRSGSKRDIHLCQECGLLYPKPRMEEGESIEYATSLYKNRPFSDFSDPSRLAGGYRFKRLLEARGSFLNLAAFILNKGVPRGIALDVGSSIGYFCKALDSMGFIAYGLEPSQRSADFACYKGLKVFCGSFPDNIPEQIVQEKFEMISMLESIYYINDLKNGLKTVRRMLKPDGFLLLKCHHADSAYYKNQDRSLFKRYGDSVQFIPRIKSLGDILKREGFDIVAVKGSFSPATSPFSFGFNSKSGVIRKMLICMQEICNKFYESMMLNINDADQVIILARKRKGTDV